MAPRITIPDGWSRVNYTKLWLLTSDIATAVVDPANASVAVMWPDGQLMNLRDLGDGYEAAAYAEQIVNGSRERHETK